MDARFRKYTRCVVTAVEEGMGDKCGRRGWEKHLSLTVERTGETRAAVLCDEWTQTDAGVGDVVHIIGDFTPSPPGDTPARPPTVVLSSSPHLPPALLILHPDVLVSATKVSDIAMCMRKPLIQEKLRTGPGSEVSEAVVWGIMLHEVLQACLRGGDVPSSDVKTDALDSTLSDSPFNFSPAFVEYQIGLQIAAHLDSLFSIGVDVEEARVKMREKAAPFARFAEVYVPGGDEEPKHDAVLVDARTTDRSRARLSISGLHDIEEDIWSPMYGLKGKIDASVRCVVVEAVDPQTAAAADKPRGRTGDVVRKKVVSMPLEIKTGRSINVMEHRAQTMLYTLMMSDRYGTDVDAGLLYYSQSGELHRVPRSRNEVRGLIIGRNEMAAYLLPSKRADRSTPTSASANVSANVDGDVDVDLDLDMDMEFYGEITSSGNFVETQTQARSVLPPTIDRPHACRKCYAVDGCMLYKRAVEDAEDDRSPISEIYQQKTGHLTVRHRAFFKKWEELISLEQEDAVRFRKELWTLTAEERQRTGRCFANMVIDYGFRQASAADAQIHRYTYKFVPRLPPSSTLTPASAQSLLNGHIVQGDPVTVSVEPHLLAIARGFVLELTPHHVVIGVDHPLSSMSSKAVDKDLESLPVLQASRPFDPRTVFRVDRDELSAGMGRIRENLAHLFYADDLGDHVRRRLIVDLEAPRFDDGADGRCDGTLEEDMPAHLNDDQREAMRKVLRAKDYALILGMPGTGKTTTIAEIIRMLRRKGRSVLLTSYTHSAVDNILLKLKDVPDLGILRLGNVDKIHPDIVQYTLGYDQPAKNLTQLEHQLMSPPVVATTCLTINHALFTRRRFDYCIVDEASQITLPTCLGPLRFADVFVLVGDHFQLPPLVRNPSARAGGLEVSLFKLLSDAAETPERTDTENPVVHLSAQYRMCDDIMGLSNRLIYGDRLRCGSEDVRKRSMRLERLPQLVGELVGDLHLESDKRVTMCSNSCWVKRVLSEDTKVVFLDTDLLPAHDSRVGDLVQNELEAELVFQATQALLLAGARESDIGIITPYRQQIKYLAHLFGRAHKVPGMASPTSNSQRYGENLPRAEQIPEEEVKESTSAKSGVEIFTADRSQGRDKECIIISLVRSNSQGQVGELLRDWRRLNVSFTRARSKLIIIGSKSTLSSADASAKPSDRPAVLRDFLDLLEQKGWVYALPKGAIEAHAELLGGQLRLAKAEPPELWGISCPTSSPPSAGKENVNLCKRPSNEKRTLDAAKKAKIGEGALLNGRPLLRDVVNELK